MKKFVSFILCTILLICGVFALVGCTNNAQGIDLSKLSEGDEIPVYPNCEFDYILSYNESEYSVHIKSISATLTDKNHINDGDTLNSEFNPYTIKIKAIGTTNLPIGTKLAINIYYADSMFINIRSDVDTNGNIVWEYDIKKILNMPKFHFSSINIVK